MFNKFVCWLDLLIKFEENNYSLNCRLRFRTKFKVVRCSSLFLVFRRLLTFRVDFLVAAAGIHVASGSLMLAVQVDGYRGSPAERIPSLCGMEWEQENK